SPAFANCKSLDQAPVGCHAATFAADRGYCPVSSTAHSLLSLPRPQSLDFGFCQPLPWERSVGMRTILLGPLIGACILAAGCGNPSGTYPVSGKVLYRGEPATGAVVTFVRRDAADRMHEQVPQGVVRDDGTFSLASPLGAGALPGEYAVLVEW